MLSIEKKVKQALLTRKMKKENSNRGEKQKSQDGNMVESNAGNCVQSMCESDTLAFINNVSMGSFEVKEIEKAAINSIDERGSDDNVVWIAPWERKVDSDDLVSMKVREYVKNAMHGKKLNEGHAQSEQQLGLKSIQNIRHAIHSVSAISQPFRKWLDDPELDDHDSGDFLQFSDTAALVRSGVLLEKLNEALGEKSKIYGPSFLNPRSCSVKISKPKLSSGQDLNSRASIPPLELSKFK